MAYTDDPAYQRAIQKLLSLPPHIRAVINPSRIDAAFAARDTQKQIELKRLGDRKRFSEERLALGRNRLALREDEYDYAHKQRKYANILAAIGVPISGAAGYMDMERKRRMASLLRPPTAPAVNALATRPVEDYQYYHTRAPWLD